jgi:DnaJ-domain-containing protein 1
VSIGKRIINLAKSELNSLLERAARLDDDNDDSDSPREPDGFGEPPPPNAAPPRRESARGRPLRVEELTDQELEAEIERRRLDREIEERSRRAGAQSQARRAEGANAGTGSSGGSRSSARGGGPGDAVTRAYAALEVPPGSDFETVRKAYRNMMRKYHPDRHAATPEKQKAANELAQKLSESYRLLEKRLRVR